jgi:hypothetical protein
MWAAPDGVNNDPTVSSAMDLFVQHLGNVNQVGPVILLIAYIAIGWNYIKLLLEAVERYIVVGVLGYTSPLALATGSSKDSANVLKGWGRMYGSQLLLLVFNVWFIRAFNSGLWTFMVNAETTFETANNDIQGQMFLWLFSMLAILKVGQRVDSYMASMGLNVAQTGGGLGMEVMAAFGTLRGTVQGITNGARGAGRSGSASSMSPLSGLGAAEAVRTAGIKVTPGQSVSGVSQNAARTRQAFTIDGPNGSTIVNRQRADAFSPPRGAYVREKDANGQMWYKTADGPDAGSILAPQFGDGSGNDGFQVTPQPETSNQIAGRDLAEMYRNNYSEALSQNMSIEDAAAYASEKTGEDVRSAAISRAMEDGLGEDVARQIGDNAYEGYQQYQNEASSVFGDQMPAGAVLENGEDPGVLHMYGTDEYGQPYEREMFLSTANTEPEVPYSTVYDTNGNQWHTVDVAQRPEYTGTTDDYSRTDFTNSYMPSLETQIGDSVSHLDYSRSQEGVYEVQTNDGKGYMLSDASMYQEPTGKYSTIEDSHGHVYYMTEGERKLVTEMDAVGNMDKIPKIVHREPKKARRPKRNK